MVNEKITHDCRWWGRAVLALFLGFASVARAGDPADELFVAQGAGRLVTLSASIGSVTVGDRRTVHAKLVSPKTIHVFGVAKGNTDLTVLSDEGKAIASIHVVVAADAAKAAQQKRHPDSGLVYDVVGTRLVPRGGSGPTQDTPAAPRALDHAAGRDHAGNEAIDAGSQQITLKVRFAEVSRSQVQNLDLDWNAVFSSGISDSGLTSGGAVGQVAGNLSPRGTLTGGILGGRVNAEVILEALESRGVVHTIAAPNLTVKSGHTAKFRAGGDIPVPVPQTGATGAITIEYHSYGVSLEFTPVLIGHDRVAIHVVPEVSEISNVNAVSFSGASIPSFTVRRSETDVDLASGQTFALAGLFQRNLSDTASGLSELKEIPVIGTLFKSREYQRGESELVILITPYLVEPISQMAATPPTEKAGDKLGPPPPPLATERIGFIVE